MSQTNGKVRVKCRRIFQAIPDSKENPVPMEVDRMEVDRTDPLKTKPLARTLITSTRPNQPVKENKLLQLYKALDLSG